MVSILVTSKKIPRFLLLTISKDVYLLEMFHAQGFITLFSLMRWVNQIVGMDAVEVCF